MAPIPQSVRCPVCRKAAPWQGNPNRPFCSERCKLRDLGHWASERYRIAGEKASAEDRGEQDDEEGQP